MTFEEWWEDIEKAINDQQGNFSEKGLARMAWDTARLSGLEEAAEIIESDVGWSIAELIRARAREVGK